MAGTTSRQFFHFFFVHSVAVDAVNVASQCCPLQLHSLPYCINLISIKINKMHFIQQPRQPECSVEKSAFGIVQLHIACMHAYPSWYASYLCVSVCEWVNLHSTWWWKWRTWPDGRTSWILVSLLLLALGRLCTRVLYAFLILYVVVCDINAWYNGNMPLSLSQ